jgi:hypothetical protein
VGEDLKGSVPLNYSNPQKLGIDAGYNKWIFTLSFLEYCGKFAKEKHVEVKNRLMLWYSTITIRDPVFSM